MNRGLIQPKKNRNYIPTITLMKLPRKNWPLQVNAPTQLVIKFTNPLYEEMSITLATPQLMKKKDQDDGLGGGKVTILSPHFTVGAYNETIEYDDEMYPTGSRRNNSTTTNNFTSGSVDGVYEKRNNYTSIIVEVVPDKPGEFKVLRDWVDFSCKN